MENIQKDKLVLFGAGKIGRSFIGQLFSVGGYQVVFVDIYKPVIDEINRRKNYNVVIKSEGREEILTIKNVRGVYARNKNQVIHEVATAGIVAVSVGLHGLDSVFPLLARGLLKRQEISSSLPLDIIIAENMRNADAYFHAKLLDYLPVGYPIDQRVGLVTTSIGKMVPIMHKKDIRNDSLQIFAEPYNMLILDKRACKNPIPDIKGLMPKENMKAWVDRKLFIHNLGHAATAYIGYIYNQRFIYIYEALAVKEVFDLVKATMLQSADILRKRYPDEFTAKDLEDHVDDLLMRFQNKALGDTIFRVGSDLIRKLGPEDRLAGAIRSAMDHNLSYDKILFSLVCGCNFRAKDEEGNLFTGDKKFIHRYGNNVRQILTDVSGFDGAQYEELLKEAEYMQKQLIDPGNIGLLPIFRR